MLFGTGHRLIFPGLPCTQPRPPATRSVTPPRVPRSLWNPESNQCRELGVNKPQAVEKEPCSADSMDPEVPVPSWRPGASLPSVWLKRLSTDVDASCRLREDGRSCLRIESTQKNHMSITDDVYPSLPTSATLLTPAPTSRFRCQAGDVTLAAENAPGTREQGWSPNSRGQRRDRLLGLQHAGSHTKKSSACR